MTALAPATLDEAAEVMRRAARERRRVAFAGGGTALGLGHDVEVDWTVRTERLARIVEYAPSDMVMVVEAGVPVAAVQAAAREHRQMLALDPPLAERATIGGVVATNAFGPRRARYGGVRDLIIGVTLVRADGVVARGGGKVVKNVAGFDLPKVAVGSLGTLALIAAAAFRLHPLPEATETVRVAGLDAEGVVGLVAAITRAQLEPAAVVAVWDGAARFDVGVRFEGFARGVARQVARLAAGAADGGELWARHDAARIAAGLRVKLASLPTRLPLVARTLRPLLESLDGASFVWYATLGLGFAGGRPRGDAAATVEALRAARAALVESGGSLVVEVAEPPVRGAVDPWGPEPGGFAVMRALKERFDPERRLAPGRFVGGL